MLKIAIDRGGTFTDIYAEYNGNVVVKKILSESPFYEDSNTQAVKEVCRDLGIKFDPEKIEWIRLGTTVATNALLERKGSPLTLVVTKGFKDILEIRDQKREDLFALDIKKPSPLYSKVVEIDERVLPGKKVLKALERELEFKENTAVVFLHSYEYPKHEKMIKGKSVSRSHEVYPVINAVYRADTTVVDAYLTPVIREYVEKIKKNLKNIYFIKSDGGLCPAEEFRGANSLLSGPAGGVVALKSIYRQKPLIGFDMGGTSTDVSRYDGEVELKYFDKIAGVYISYPMVDIHTVAAGGGSRLFYKNGMFTVGPQSSGSSPGPLCYGRDGYLSVTDANMATGRIDEENFPKIFGKSGKESLDKKASLNGFKPIAQKLGKSVEEIAEAFIDVANENMANAIKEITVKKGFDPKEHILCSFGGAGAQHAVGIARKLGIDEIFIHAQSGVLCAVGIANADITKSETTVVEKPLKEVDLEKLFDKCDIKKLFLKYKNTNTAVEVEYKEGFLDEFKQKYKRMFGFLLDTEIILQSIQKTYVQKSPKIKRNRIKNAKMSPFKTKKIFLNGKWQNADVYKEIFADNKIKGPALILQNTTTLLLDEKSTAFINEYGDITVKLEKMETKTLLNEAKLSLFANRLGFIAAKMGDILKKTAMSANIKEREDFSCAIFDKDGNLITNAPHIPVHLGSMSSVIKSIIKKHKIQNSVYISNAPYEGGSHLPDITVAVPYFKNGKVVFWTASRGHHADIGGATPGSMPPFSKTLSEEGAVIESFEIVKDGKFEEEKIKSILKKAGARKIEENISDIKAQISANLAGIEELEKLELNDLEWFFENIQQISSQKTENFFKNLKEVSATEYLDNGAVIKFRAYKKEKTVFDFRGSSPELLSNQNLPFSVLKSAVMYALRVMLNEDIPLNEGILKNIEIKVDENSLLNPSPLSAVVGGNVTTSQRIVDVIFKAFEIASASQGCMNNVIFGNENFGYYETIGGGAGAGDGFEGASGVHTHMTNTKITDVEVIERRYPVMIEEFSLRKNSGGEGKYKGGDGLKRIYRFLENVDVSVLSERRVFAPYGLKGGKNGKKGKNLLVKKDKTFNLTGKNSFKAEKGDKLIILTPGGGGFFSP